MSPDMQFYGLCDHMPARLAAGHPATACALRDLVVTSDHALLLDGVLVQAGALVNATTISRLSECELRAGLTVFHIETGNHEIVLAEGTPAETFVDNVTRRMFDNYDEFEDLYGPAPDAVVERDEPRAMSARQVSASVRARIAQAASANAATPRAA